MPDFPLKRPACFVSLQGVPQFLELKFIVSIKGRTREVCVVSEGFPRVVRVAGQVRTPRPDRLGAAGDVAGAERAAIGGEARPRVLSAPLSDAALESGFHGQTL